MEGASDLRNCKTNNEWAFACDPESGPEVFFSRMLLDPILISMAVPKPEPCANKRNLPRHLRGHVELYRNRNHNFYNL